LSQITSPATAEFRESRRALWVAPAVVFLLAQLVASVLLVTLWRGIQAKDRASFEGEVTRTTDAMRQRIETTIALLHGTAGLFAARGDVSREEFSSFVGRLSLRERYPGILGIGYTARLAPAQVAATTERMRAGGFPAFTVWPEGPRDEYHAIFYLEPLDERNRAAIGYDMYTNDVRREAMARARDSGRAAASGKVILVQEIEERKQAGFLIYVPVYTAATPPGAPLRRASLRGFVYSPLRADDLLAGVAGSGVRQLAYKVFDEEAVAANLMRATPGADAEAPAHSAQRELEIAGRRWIIRFSSRPEFEALSQQRLLPLLALASLAASLLLGWITFVQVRARRDAEAAAAQREANEKALQASQARELERAHRLEQLYGELREGERHKDEFLAVLAHELRNPLAPIRTALEVIRRAPGSDSAERARAIAERQVKHMVRLVDDLLDVSRISRGKIALQRGRVALRAVVEAAVETSRSLIGSFGHQLHVQEIDPRIEVDADPDRLAQVFTNLLNNAANYTPPGGRIDVLVQPDGDWIRIGVRDNGIGIDPQRLGDVFGMFTQLGRTHAGGGLGIGLSLAARLVELHGGRIEAASEGAGRGSQFTVFIPRHVPGEGPVGAPAPGTAHGNERG
jgi:signal transduction histidine kinase